MIHKLPDELKLELINDKITNVENIITFLKSVTNYDMLEEYYNFLTSNLDFKHYENINIIISAIKSHLNTLEQKVNLKKELENVKKANKSLRNFSLIEDLKEQNDVNKDVYYLKYVDEENVVHIIEIDNTLKLLDLISTRGPIMTGQEFYNLLKNRYFNELQKYSLGTNKIDLVTYEHSYLIKDKPLFLIEKELLDAYMKLNYPNVVPEISVDSHDERLYYINSTIIKFYDEDGKRKMNIVSQEKEHNEEEKNNENNELDLSAKSSTAYIEEDTEISRSDLENIEISTEEVMPLIEKFVTAKSLNKEEKIKIYSYLKDLLDTKELELDLSNKEEELLGATVDYLRTKTSNNVEKEILNRYNNFSERQDLAKSKEEIKRYTLKGDNPLKLNDDGVSLSIIIITVTVLLGALLAAIILVK